MTVVSPADEDDLRALDALRCAAISDGDLEVLATLLADDLRHVHVTGAVQDKDAYLAALERRPRRAQRGELTVRVEGDVAVMSGIQCNTRPGHETDRLQVLQVWQRRNTRWQLVDFAASGPLAEGP